MRSHKEMAENVIRRRDQFLEEKKKRRTMIVRTVTASFSTAAVVLFGFALWKDDLINSMRPDPDKYPITTEYPIVSDTVTATVADVTEPAVSEVQTSAAARTSSATQNTSAAATASASQSRTAASTARTADTAPVITPSQTHRPASSSAVRTTSAPPRTTAAPRTTAPQQRTTAAPVTTTAHNELPVTTVSPEPVIVTAAPSIPRTEAPTTQDNSEPPTTRRSSTVPYVPSTGEATVAHSTNTVQRSSAVIPQTEMPTTPVTTSDPHSGQENMYYVERFWFGGWWMTDGQSSVPDSDVGMLLDSVYIGDDGVRADIFAVSGYGDNVIGVRFNGSERMYLCYPTDDPADIS